MVKNDVRTADTSIECKITEKQSFSLKRDDLMKAEFNAAADNRDMLFKITFVGSYPRRSVKPLSYIVLPEEDYLRMREQLGTQAQSGTTGRLETG